MGSSIPLHPRMCSVISKTQGRARIQRGPWAPGRARLSGCGTAGAQERRDSGIRRDGGLDEHGARLHRVGAPAAPAASLCRWARGDGGTRGSSPCGWGCLAQALPCALNPSDGASTRFPLSSSHPGDVPLGVFDVLALPATAVPWLRSTGRLRGRWCGCTDQPWLSGGDFSCLAACRRSADTDQTCPSCRLGETKLLTMAFLGVTLFPGSKLCLIFFFSPTEFKGARGSPALAKTKPLGRAVESQAMLRLTPAPRHRPGP